MRVFLITGASIGVVGTLVGALLGILFCWKIDEIRQFVAWLTDTQPVQPRDLLPDAGSPPTSTRAPPTIIVVMALVLSVLATLYPVLARVPTRSRRSAALRVSAQVRRGVRQCRTPPPARYCSSLELTRTFRQGDREIPVLKGASAELYPGQAVALVGPSGAGKSTLLHIAGLLETPDGGRVIVSGADCSRARRYRAHARAAHRDGLRLPVPPAAAGVHGAGERADAADDPRRRRAGARRSAGEAAARACWASAERLDHRPGAALGRRAAAHGHRPRARQCAQAPAGGRADRQPRSRPPRRTSSTSCWS